MSKFSDAYITTVLGMRGCGKSTLTKILSRNHPRLIIFDIVDEWAGTHVAHNFQEFANIWRDQFNQGKYQIVIKFKFGTDQKTIIDIQTQITTLIYITGKDSGIETCIIFEECQFYFPNHGLHAVNMHLLTTGRHAFINIIANSQRPASISKLLISQSKKIYVGQLYEANDIGYLYETLGDLATESPNLKPMEFIFYPVGEHDSIAIIEI